MITQAMRALIEENTLAFVATVTPDGAPAVSPKGTTVVLDERTIAFSDIRSPQTVRNIRHNPAVELNFIDVFRRQACRLKGRAEYVERGSARYQALQPHFAHFMLAARMRGFVVVTIEKAQIILSPVYDDGATESDLRKQWLKTFTDRHG
jgi:uncharacterized protein